MAARLCLFVPRAVKEEDTEELKLKEESLRACLEVQQEEGCSSFVYFGKATEIDHDATQQKEALCESHEEYMGLPQLRRPPQMNRPRISENSESLSCTGEHFTESPTSEANELACMRTRGHMDGEHTSWGGNASRPDTGQENAESASVKLRRKDRIRFSKVTAKAKRKCTCHAGPTKSGIHVRHKLKFDVQLELEEVKLQASGYCKQIFQFSAKTETDRGIHHDIQRHMEILWSLLISLLGLRKLRRSRGSFKVLLAIAGITGRERAWPG
ncbi:hypothetical protein C8R47DRAFT_1084531 [Mycena vitilis]|nr:hypothetical protein C8R47DRAFT_1084531 [Mycena vitilis]